MLSELHSIVVTYAVPVCSPVSEPSAKAHAQPLPPLDKTPRYKSTMRFDAGPSNWSEHEVRLSLDQIARILRIVNETTGEDGPNG